MYENKILHFFMYNTDNSKNTFVFSHILFISKQTILPGLLRKITEEEIFISD